MVFLHSFVHPLAAVAGAFSTVLQLHTHYVNDKPHSDLPTDDKWHGLRASSEQRRKSLEDMVSDLRDMREHEEQLMRWLAQKERMLDVLGPVAMEPAMLASQLQQVKVRLRTYHQTGLPPDFSGRFS